MQHPLLQRLSFLTYIGALLLLGSVSVYMGMVKDGIPLRWALLDAGVFYAWFFVLGLSMWYFVCHTWSLRLSFWHLFSIHLVAVICMTVIWIAGGYGLLSMIFGEEPSYLTYLENTMIWRFLGGMFYFILTVLSYFLFLSMDDRKQRMESEQTLRDSLREAELELLKSQINPHFLFNSLNSVSLLTLTNSEKAHQMIVALSEYLRYSISGKHDTLATLRTEIDNVNRYLEIERIRFGNRLRIEFQCDESCYPVPVPAMLLQPLYENAIKHGVYESTGQVEIRTSIAMHGDFMEIIIANNFERANSSKKGAGLGLRNVQDRLRMVYGSDIARMHTEKTEQLFTARIIIPREKA